MVQLNYPSVMKKRFSYLDHPEVPKHGLRALVLVQF
jgi:hypothetical protein